MNSNRPAFDEGKLSRKIQSLSRFHPRSLRHLDEEQEFSGGEGLKNKAARAHAPAEIRTAPGSPCTAALIRTSTKNIIVPRPKPALPDPEPSAEAPLPVSPAVPRIPAWLLSETAIAFKVGAVVIFLLGAMFAFKFGEYRGRKVALRESKPALAGALAAVPAATPAPPPAEFPEELLPAFDTALKTLRKGDNLDALDALNKLVALNPKAPSIHYAAALAAFQAG